MNKIRRGLAIVLAASMAASLAACGSNGNQSTNNNAASTAPAASTASAAAETEYFPRPSTEELSVWVSWSANTVENISDVRAVQEMEKLTNVHINYTTVNSQEEKEKYGLMLVSGNFPDIHCGNNYPTGLAGGLKDGVYQDLTDAIPQYMPRYWEIIQSNPEYDKMTKLDDGKRVAVYQANCYNYDRIEGENPWIGTAIRRDWLEEQGLETPVTIDDWHNVLTVFKEKYGAYMTIGAAGYNQFHQDFVTAYGVLAGMYNDNGTVKYGPAEDAFKEYLKTMRQWYVEGLIDQNFTSFSEWTDPNSRFGKGEIGAGPIIGSNAGTTLLTDGYTDDPDFYLETVPAAVLNKGDKPQYGMDITAFSRFVTLATSCKNTELALRYIDLFFDRDIADLNFYGIEGESYVKNGDEYEFTDAIRHDPNGVGASDKIAEYILKSGEYFGWYNWAYAVPLVKSDDPNAPDLNALQETWKVNTDLCMPSNMTMTPEETTEYYTYFTDLQTRTNEYIARAITGQEDLEKYDEFVNSLKSIGLDRCIEIQQAALDRYNAR